MSENVLLAHLHIRLTDDEVGRLSTAYVAGTDLYRVTANAVVLDAIGYHPRVDIVLAEEI